MTRLTVPIAVDTYAAALSLAVRAAEFGADLVEYRLDAFVSAGADLSEAKLRDIEKLVRDSPLPCIVTCRPVWEGGDYDGDEMHRISLLEHAALGPGAGGSGITPAYLDVELRAYETSANLRQKIGLVIDHEDQPRPEVTTGLILSSHDFETMPPDLDRKLMAMATAPACRVIKLAWRARSLRDNLEAFEIVRRRLKPTIALCMGEAGLPSRVLAKKFGALLTFASLDKHHATAPGQPTVAELKQCYRWDQQTPETRVYGVIGFPVGHSVSPAFHNAGFDATGYDGVYLPLPIPPEYEHFKATVLSWLDYAPLHFRGASVTIPHKQNLLRFVEEQGGEIEPLAATIGAANTLHRRGDGSLYAGNTDYAAILDAVCDAWSIGPDQLADKRVAVLGAGGAARAAVAGFAHHAAAVTVFNRTVARAQALADTFGAEAQPLEALDPYRFDLVVNCTPVGMHPHPEASPAVFGPPPAEGGAARPLVFDTIYNPAETRLLREAAAAGCATLAGREMFLRQGAAQFALWTGLAPPLDVLRELLTENLPS
ncbi:MAG: type I 3-dehydroquinate dehydratase [Planctomycetota bacterium]